MVVRIGDSFKSGRYVVRSRLGWGRYSIVWRAWDTHKSQYVALKVLDSAKETARDEIKILQQIATGDPEDTKCVVKLLDHCKHSGPNGEHVCMVFECLGDHLSTLIRRLGNRRLPISKVKEICLHFLVGLDYLHRELSIVHNDLKPENVLLLSRIDPSNDLASVDLKCKLVDFGKAHRIDTKFLGEPQSGPYRSPELILRSDYSTSADLWSFACICFQLATGVVLFNYDNTADKAHLDHMKRLSDNPQEIALVLVEKRELSEQDANGMADFLGRILVLDPERRPTAARCLEHPWITQR